MHRGRIILVSIAGLAAIVLGVSSSRSPIAADPPPLPSSGCGAASIQHGRRIEQSIEAAGRERSYILDVPDSVSAGVPAPLLLDFHGFGHSGAGVWKVSGFRAVAEREGFITAYPDGSPVTLRLLGQQRDGLGWDISSANSRDVKLTRALLDRLEGEYCIDRRRIFVTGFSNGAYLCSLLGCAMAERIAAIAPVSGGPLLPSCEPARGVPVLIQHGRQDDLIPVAQARAARDQWVVADRCPEGTSTQDGCEHVADCRDAAVVTYCEGDNAHRWPADATQKIWAFFTDHPMPAR